MGRGLRTHAAAGRVTLKVAGTIVLVLATVVVGTGARGANPGVNGRIAFFSNASSGAGIFTMAPDGGDTHRLVAGGTAPYWSPDGTKVAYTVGQDLLVVRVKPDGKTADGEPINLTKTTNASALRQNASWSHDGTQLVYERWSDKNKFDIWKATPDLESGNLGPEQRLTTTPRAEARHPAWSPLGGRIAFASNRDGDWEIYTMDAGDGPNVVQVTCNSVDDVGPDWSPDGAQIVFTRTQPSKGKVANTDVYRIAAEGCGQSVQLTTDATADGAPDWSPDGLLVAFVRGSGAASEIYTKSAVNGDRAGISRRTSNEVGDFSPDWQAVAGEPQPPTPPPCLLDVCPPLLTS